MTEHPDAWFDPAPDQPIPLLAALRDDLQAHVPVSRLGGSWPRRALQWLLIAVRSTGFHATLAYRLSHTLRGRFGPPGRLAAALLSWCVRRAYRCAIAPTARLHGGLILPHPQGIVIDAGTVVGPRAWIFQNVAIGMAPGRAGMPRIGADARIFAGAVLTGPISVGDRVAIGANAIVHRDVFSRSIVRPPAAEFVPRTVLLGVRPTP
jgi:serine O-acetyltransferase